MNAVGCPGAKANGVTPAGLSRPLASIFVLCPVVADPGSVPLDGLLFAVGRLVERLPVPPDG